MALDHAWNWFSLHSGQRMQLLSFFFVALALLLAGYTAALGADRPVVALALAASGVVIAAAFGLVDRRTSRLIKAAEVPLQTLQQKLAAASNIPTIELVTQVEDARPRASSYSRVVLTIVITSVLLMGFGVAYAIYDLAHDEPTPSRHHQGLNAGRHPTPSTAHAEGA